MGAKTQAEERALREYAAQLRAQAGSPIQGELPKRNPFIAGAQNFVHAISGGVAPARPAPMPPFQHDPNAPGMTDENRAFYANSSPLQKALMEAKNPGDFARIMEQDDLFAEKTPAPSPFSMKDRVEAAKTFEPQSVAELGRQVDETGTGDVGSLRYKPQEYPPDKPDKPWGERDTQKLLVNHTSASVQKFVSHLGEKQTFDWSLLVRKPNAPGVQVNVGGKPIEHDAVDKRQALEQYDSARTSESLGRIWDKVERLGEFGMTKPAKIIGGAVGIASNIVGPSAVREAAPEWVAMREDQTDLKAEAGQLFTKTLKLMSGVAVNPAEMVRAQEWIQNYPDNPLDFNTKLRRWTNNENFFRTRLMMHEEMTRYQSPTDLGPQTDEDGNPIEEGRPYWSIRPEDVASRLNASIEAQFNETMVAFVDAAEAAGKPITPDELPKYEADALEFAMESVERHYFITTGHLKMLIDDLTRRTDTFWAEPDYKPRTPGSEPRIAESMSNTVDVPMPKGVSAEEQ